MKNKWIKFYIEEINQGKSIRAFIEDFYVSHKKIYKLSIDHAIKLNDQETNLDTILKAYDVLEIDETSLAPSKVEPYPGEIDIVFEDEDILVLNKPTHLLVYSDGQDYDTLTNRVAQRMNSYYPILPVHRIDYETSGLVLFAKHPMIQSYLSKLFEIDGMKKTYICLVETPLKQPKGEINQPIARDRHSEKMRVSSNGKEAHTSYEVIGEVEGLTKLKVMISSGRKHQIRVHLRSIGHPVVSDQLYEHINLKYPRLMLHFESIEFIHPRTKEYVKISSIPAF